MLEDLEDRGVAVAFDYKIGGSTYIGSSTLTFTNIRPQEIAPKVGVPGLPRGSSDCVIGYRIAQ
jgi:hypothetical protein